MTVHERIAIAQQVIAETDFAKSGQVQGGQSYKFIPIGQILNAVRRAHSKAGIFITTGPLEYDEDRGERRYSYTKKGQYGESVWHAAIGHCEVTVHGADGDFIAFSVPFEAQDNSDKLTNKIITNIERQTYRILYAIDEGDASDPEATWEEMPVAPATRAEKMAKADPFFKQDDSREKDIRAKAFALRPTVEKFVAEHSDSDLVKDYLDRYGPVGEWADTIIVRAWTEDFKGARE